MIHTVPALPDIKAYYLFMNDLQSMKTTKNSCQMVLISFARTSLVYGQALVRHSMQVYHPFCCHSVPGTWRCRGRGGATAGVECGGGGVGTWLVNGFDCFEAAGVDSPDFAGERNTDTLVPVSVLRTL